MPSLTAAREAKANTHLAHLVRTSAYGVVTRKERIERSVADGCTLETAEVRDDARERAIEREMHQLREYRTFGNECHPKKIQYERLKAELAAQPKTAEYRLNRPDGAYWNVLTKTEFDFAQSLPLSLFA